MSQVTTLLINIPFGESRDADADLVEYFETRSTTIRSLGTQSEAWGGNKGPLIRLYAGAYSRFDVEGLLDHLQRINWKQPTQVQVFERPEDHGRFNVYTMTADRRWHRPPLVQAAHLP